MKTIGDKVFVRSLPSISSDLHGISGTIEDIKPSLINGEPAGNLLLVVRMDEPCRMPVIQAEEHNFE